MLNNNSINKEKRNEEILKHIDHVFGEVFNSLSISRKSRNELIDSVGSLINNLLNFSKENSDVGIHNSEIRKDIYFRMYVQKSL